MSTVIRSGHNGYAETDEGALAARMHHLIERPDVAARLGANARRTARARFGLGRFVADWDALLSGHALPSARSHAYAQVAPANDV